MSGKRGSKMYKMYELKDEGWWGGREGGGGVGGDINPLHPELILQATCTCQGRPGCFNNSESRQSQTQTEINRILHYTKPLIKIFAQILGAWQIHPGCSRWMKTAKQHRDS